MRTTVQDFGSGEGSGSEPPSQIGALKVIVILHISPERRASALQNWTQLDGCGAWFGTELQERRRETARSILGSGTPFLTVSKKSLPRIPETVLQSNSAHQALHQATQVPSCLRACVLSSFRCFQPFVTPWTNVACQDPLSM